jgi:pimeloyl-ACP methyl ester carboxylesterase
MKTRRRTCVLAVIATALSVLTPLSASAARPGIAWAPCAEYPAAECGTLSVPVDWNRPRGPRIDLALARLRATDPATKIGSLVINTGGPGGSGVDSVFAVDDNDILSDEMRRHFDVVGFDPRGAARSHPVVCSSELWHRRPFPYPENAAEFEAFVAFNGELRADCRARTGPLFDHTDTRSVVHDVDAIRAAVGDERLTFVGGSYGTLIGQQYAEQYPGRVRALYLDSQMDHSLDTRGFLDTLMANFQDSFNEFVAWCDRDTGCALHGRDVRAVWADLMDRAERGELPDPDDPGRALRPSSLARLAKEHFAGVAWAELAQAMHSWPAGTGMPPSEPARTELVHLPMSLGCNDFALPVRSGAEYEAHLRRLARIGPDVRYPASNLFTDCLGYPTDIPNPRHRLKVRHLRTPILVVNALHDANTGYNWAEGVAAQLGPAGRLFTYDGWGHGVYGNHRGDCMDRAIDDYLISLTLPPPRAHCPAVPPGLVKGATHG